MKRLVLFLIFLSSSSFTSFGVERSFTSHFSYYMNKHIGVDGVFGLTIISDDESVDSGIRIEMNFGTGIQGFNMNAFSLDLWSDVTLLIRRQLGWLWYYFSFGGKIRIHPGYGSYGFFFGIGTEIPISRFFITSGLIINILSKDTPQENSGIMIGAGFRF